VEQIKSLNVHHFGMVVATGLKYGVINSLTLLNFMKIQTFVNRLIVGGGGGEHTYSMMACLASLL
jgi:hypothetical protein